MLKRGAALAGGTLIAIGVAGGGYAYWRYRQSKASAGLVAGASIAISDLPLPATDTLENVTVSFTNGGSQQQVFGVQAAWLEEFTGADGVIGGHLFTSAVLAQQADQDPSTAGALVTTPADRVATTSLAGGAAGSVTLYGFITPSALVGPFGLVVWIVPAPAAGTLLASDPVGMRASQTSSAGRSVSQTLASA